MATVNLRRLPVQLTTVAISSTGTTIELVPAPAAGYQTIIWGYILSTAGTSLQFKDGSTALTGAIATTAIQRDVNQCGAPAGGASPMGYPKHELTAATAFNCTQSGSALLSGVVMYETIVAGSL